MLLIKPNNHLNNKIRLLPQLQQQKGFTLIEIMVVMVILGVLIAAVAPNILGRADESKITSGASDTSRSPVSRSRRYRVCGVK